MPMPGLRNSSNYTPGMHPKPSNWKRLTMRVVTCRWRLCPLGGGFLMLAFGAFAQVPSTAHSAANTATTNAVTSQTPPLAPHQPKAWVPQDIGRWQTLSRAQKTALQPLAAKWDTLGKIQRHKWLVIAANYAKLSPVEQQKLHERMTDWAALDQRQRSQARLNFAKSKKLTPDQKKQSWQAYQALSPEEKKRLANSAAKKFYAAPAVKPSLQPHIVTPSANPPGAQIAALRLAKINPHTLLPVSPW
jgi:hypothetical protein